MSFSITIGRANGVREIFEISQSDMQLLSMLGRDDAKVARDIEVLWGDDLEHGEWRKVRIELLVNAIREIVEAIRRESDRLPFVYRYLMEHPRWPKEWASGGLGGIRIGADYFALDTGLGECSLKRYSITEPGGSGRIVEVRDLRNTKELPTDNFGVIQFRRTKKRMQIFDVFSRLEEFLVALPNEEVVTIGAG